MRHKMFRSVYIMIDLIVIYILVVIYKTLDYNEVNSLEMYDLAVFFLYFGETIYFVYEWNSLKTQK